MVSLKVHILIQGVHSSTCAEDHELLCLLLVYRIELITIIIIIIIKKNKKIKNTNNDMNNNNII